jgi:DNA-directed RNA polymerase subunit RPC12/RpoP
MIIIFGTRNRYTLSKPGETLPNACPNCGNHLVLKDHKTWGTLFFLPIFPVHTIGKLYECTSCKKAYRSELRDQLVNPQKN